MRRPLALALLLVAGPAAAEPAPVCAALHELETPTRSDALASIQKRATGDDEKAIARVVAAYDGGDNLALLAADAELARRCAQRATAIDDEIDAIYTLDRFWLARRKLDVGATPWHDEAMALARALTKRHPRDARAFEALGNMLGGSPGAQVQLALAAFARCRELDPKGERCRAQLGELSSVAVAEQCAGGDVRPLSLVPGTERPLFTTADVVTVRAGLPGVCDGVQIEYSFAARQRARERFWAAKEPVEGTVVVDGKPVGSDRWDWRIEGELTCLRGRRIADFCKATHTPKLPHKVAKWRKP